MSNITFDAIVCGVIAVGAAVAVKGISANAGAIDDILVAMLNAKGE